ncbi:MAG: T9SS type A sorting domain-containing protein [Bacteroidales bacterium]|nr:T9SS type A sorting domain-containing protein [Bacteroidales bacterium]
MRSLFTLLAISLLFCITVISQEIQNSGFENWLNQQYFEDPDEFTTTNIMTYFASGEANVHKTTDAYSGSFALNVETIDSPEGPIAGAVFIGEPGEGGFIGGIPYTEHPDSLKFFAKFDVPAMDTAYVAVLFKKFGAPLGICFAQLTGTQDTYQQFSVPVSWLIPVISPDTMATVIVSSTMFGMPTVGSTLTVDDITFTGATTPYPNNSFENWTEFASEEPDNWTSSNIFTLPASDVSVTKSTDSYEGNYAVRIENKLTMWDDTIGFITNGTIGDDGPTGGMPVDDVPNILSGYYKYEPVGADSALAGLMLYHYDEVTGITEILDSIYITLPAATDYTYFEVLVDYYSLPEPDTVNVAFGSGNFDVGNIGLGSVLYVDALEITYKPHIVSVEDNNVEQAPKIYPNPANEKIFFEIAELFHQPVHITIYNSGGTAVVEKEINSNLNVSLEIDHLPVGIYFYRMKVAQKFYQGKFVVE